MGPDSSRLTAQDSSARGGWPHGDWPARQRATRVHFTAISRRRALSLTTPGTPLPTAAIAEATARKDTVYTRHSLRRSSATSARLYFRLEGGLKQPIPARSGLASPAPEPRRGSSGRGNSLAPQSAEAGPVSRGLRPRTEGSTSTSVSLERPSSPRPPLGPPHHHIPFSKQDRSRPDAPYTVPGAVRLSPESQTPAARKTPAPPNRCR